MYWYTINPLSVSDHYTGIPQFQRHPFGDFLLARQNTAERFTAEARQKFHFFGAQWRAKSTGSQWQHPTSATGKKLDCIPSYMTQDAQAPPPTHGPPPVAWDGGMVLLVPPLWPVVVVWFFWSPPLWPVVVVCSYVGMYVVMYVGMYVCRYVGMYVCMHPCIHACMYACMYVCT